MVPVPNIQLVSQSFDYGATLLWAVSGAMIGARKGYAVLGVFVLALVSSTGGGLLRDGLFLQDGPPMVLRTPTYILLALSATCLILLFGRLIRKLRWFDPAITVVDALGAGLYSVVGMNMAMAAELPTAAVVMVGMVNAVGGGVLRDVLIGVEPDLFKPGKPYALTALVGCAVYVVLTLWLSADQLVADISTIATVVISRVVVYRLGVETKPLTAFSDDWRRTEMPDDPPP